MHVIHQFKIAWMPNEEDIERYAGWEFVRWLDDSYNGKLYKSHFNKPVKLRIDYLTDWGDMDIGVKVTAPLSEEEAFFYELIKHND